VADLDRRRFLTSAIASLGLAATSGDRMAAFAQAAAAAKYRIDVHSHFGPPIWVEAVKGRPLLQPSRITWTPEQGLEDLDRGGGAAAIVSITNPGVWFGDKAAASRLARACNEYGAKVVQDHPTRFGLFAAVPLPDVDATLKEIEYAYDTLHADGIGLFTSFDDNTWLGHAAYRPVMEELNRRNAVVFVHPTAANCCRGLKYAVGVSEQSMEFGFDTTRAITGIVVNGDAARFPNIRWIWSHGGGTMPFLAGRIGGNRKNEEMPNGFMHEVKKFYYDLAGAANVGVVASLQQLVATDKILLGTDGPSNLMRFAETIRSLKMFSESDLRLIERDNAVKLLPRFK
jgi:predicted TIM-barrel fold metal-dependent hydrolase